MSRPSSIARLPRDVRDKLHQFLADPAVTQIEAAELVNELLQQRGEADKQVSKSAVNRYAMRMEDVGKKLRESREVAEIWIGKLGNQPASEVGKLLNEVLRTLAFELTLPALEGDEDAKMTPKMINQLALAVQRLESAAGQNQKITAEAKRQAREEAAQAAETIAKRDGLSSESVQELRRAILGVQT